MMFRFKALQKMREPDELDSPSLLAAPRGWIAVFVIMFVVAAAATWAFIGSIPISVTAPGLLTYPQGTTSVQSPVAGIVAHVSVRPGDQLEVGDELLTVRNAKGKVVSVPSPFRGQVVGLAVSDAEIINRGDPITTVERISSAKEPIVAMIFVSEQQVQGLRPGLNAELSVSAAPAAQFGLLKGRISSVSPFPLTAGQVSALVGGDLAARQYTRSSAPHLVIVQLTPDPSTVSGFAWSTASGPPLQLRSQVSVAATVDIAHESPISLVFGR